MKMSNKGLVELVGHEGICLSKYRDSVGVWTVGVGATVSEIPDIKDWLLSKKITMQQAFDYLSRGILKYEIAVSKSLTRDVPQNQFDALVSWCYNVGVGYTKPLYNKKGEMIRDMATVIKRVNSGDSGARLYDALMMFRKPPEVTGRRVREANLLAYGRYSNEGKANLFPVSSRGYPIYSKGTTINVWEYLDRSSEVEPEPVEVPKEDEAVLEQKPHVIQRAFNWIARELQDYQDRTGRYKP